LGIRAGLRRKSGHETDAILERQPAASARDVGNFGVAPALSAVRGYRIHGLGWIELLSCLPDAARKALFLRPDAAALVHVWTRSFERGRVERSERISDTAKCL